VALRAKNKLTARKLLAGGFSKDGAQVYGIVRNTTGEGAEWQLYAIDVKTGAEKMLAPLDLPASTDGARDSVCILTATASSRPSPSGPYDIWMLEGLDQMPRKTWMERLLRSLDSTPSPGTR